VDVGVLAVGAGGVVVAGNVEVAVSVGVAVRAGGVAITVYSLSCCTPLPQVYVSPLRVQVAPTLGAGKFGKVQYVLTSHPLGWHNLKRCLASGSPGTGPIPKSLQITQPFTGLASCAGASPALAEVGVVQKAEAIAKIMSTARKSRINTRFHPPGLGSNIVFIPTSLPCGEISAVGPFPAA
jgi:hypothetical protein